MPARRHRPDVIPDDSPDLARALQLAQSLTADEREVFLRDSLRAVFSYIETKDHAFIEMLEADIRDVARLRSRPGFSDVLEAVHKERPILIPRSPYARDT
jgi:hypothetical protein